MYSHYNRQVTTSQWFDNKCNKCILKRSHYIHKYVHNMYFAFFFKYQTQIHVSSKTLYFSVQIEIDNESKVKL